MGIESEPKEFQRIIVASFTKGQLQRVIMWYRANVNFQDGRDFGAIVDEALVKAELDEQGKAMTEKAKNRIRYGGTIITNAMASGIDMNNVTGEIKLWQVKADQSAPYAFRIDWKTVSLQRKRQ